MTPDGNVFAIIAALRDNDNQQYILIKKCEIDAVNFQQAMTYASY